MKRVFIVCATVAALLSPLCAVAQTTDEETVLLDRIAARSGGTAQVLVGKVPSDMPKVPLPAATIVGSVHETIETPIAADSYDLYYNAQPDTLKTYEAALVAAGWTNHPFPLTGGGGFVSSTGPTTAIYCKEHAPLVTAQVGTDPTDFRVSISASGGAADMVCGSNPLFSMMKNTLQSPLPPLRAPDGVQMSVSPIALPNGQSAAYIHNGSSTAALLDGFAAQLTAAGWQAGAKSTGATIVSQTFQKLDEKKAPWVCVVSIYAIDGKPGEFAAFIDTANLANLAKGTSALFSH
jgi:hypothetical protein